MKNVLFALALLSSTTFASQELIKAVKDDDIQEATKLLDDEEGIDDIDKSGGRTALMYAAINGNAEIAELLLEKKPDLEIRDSFGNTALILATMFGHQPVVRLLLDQGAKVDQANSKDLTALVVASNKFDAEKKQAKKAEYKRILKLLLKNEAAYTASLVSKLDKQLGEAASNLAKYKIMLRTGIDEGAYKKLPREIIDLIISLIGNEDEPEDLAPKNRIIKIGERFLPRLFGS